MLNKIIEHLGRPDSGCWDLKTTPEMISFKSVWGNTEIIICPKKKREDVVEFQTIGGGRVLMEALGKPELSSIYYEDGIKISRWWFLKRETEPTQSTDILKDFVRECEMRKISNKIKTDYVSFQVDGYEIFTLNDGNRIDNVDCDLAEMLNEVMDKYTSGEGNFYINNKGYICE